MPISAYGNSKGLAMYANRVHEKFLVSVPNLLYRNNGTLGTLTYFKCPLAKTLSFLAICLKLEYIIPLLLSIIWHGTLRANI